MYFGHWVPLKAHITRPYIKICTVFFPSISRHTYFIRPPLGTKYYLLQEVWGDIDGKPVHKENHELLNLHICS